MKYAVMEMETLIDIVTIMIIDTAEKAVSERGKFFISLAGGSTPQAFYRKLAEKLKGQELKNKSHFFFSDERCVPPTHRDSNYYMANNTLFKKAGIPPENIHRIKGEMEPETAAWEYELELKRIMGENPVFDLSILGIGKDLHIASIFPGSDIIKENTRLCRAVYVDEINSYRITLTPVVLLNARITYFLTTGIEKADAISTLEYADYNPELFPAHLFRNHDNQRAVVFTDLQAGCYILL